MTIKFINTRIVPFFFVLVLLKGPILYAQDSLALLEDADRLEILAEHHLGLNDFNYAEELLSKTFSIRKEHLSNVHPKTISAQIELARISTKTNRLENGSNHIKEVLNLLEESPKNYSLSLYANATFVNALLLYNKKEFKKAKSAFEFYHGLVEQNPKLQETDFYLLSLIQTSYFYSGFFAFSLDRHWGSRAFHYAQMAYEKSKQHSYHGSLPHLQSIFNLSRLHGTAGNFEECLKFSKEGQSLAYGILNEITSESERIKFEKYFALLLFEETVSTFYLNDGVKDETQLKNILTSLEQTVDILERNKGALQDQRDIILVLEDYFKYITRFMDYICASLYKLTKEDRYIDELIKYHESGLYNNIRSRLVLKNINLKNLNERVQVREENLRKRIKELRQDIGNREKTNSVKAEYEIFLDSLKQDYPEYYNLKYGPLIRPIEQISQKLPEKTSVIRYFYILNRLYAIVIGPDGKTLIELPYINTYLYQNEMIQLQNSPKLGAILFELYGKLWKPLEEIVKTENVIIIPERDLFNINFETLTFSQLNSLDELAEKSLLSRYNISYNYSLFLIDRDSPKKLFDDTYIGFAPEFNKNMKEEYKLALRNNSKIDKAYLTLLPQPWTLDLTETSSKLFKGSAFTNEKASKQLFTQNASEHKIIHIGTHAESNNVSPELSRLVFAKNVLDSKNINDNYLYTYEIYNQDLSSNLAILTACETGKPSYQPGEGMISLAHAFNYAGSESILTSLWQIDEQSSTQILEYFYKYLEEGLPKDKALKLSKLDYLRSAEGRTLHPQYWAGLILMGDISPIKISTKTPLGYWIIGLFLLVIILVLLVKKVRPS